VPCSNHNSSNNSEENREKAFLVLERAPPLALGKKREKARTPSLYNRAPTWSQREQHDINQERINIESNTQSKDPARKI
jgi:hypothetical protein